MQDSIGLYLNDIGKVPLLNAEDEKELGNIVKLGILAKEKLDASAAPKNFVQTVLAETGIEVPEGHEAQELLDETYGLGNLEPNASSMQILGSIAYEQAKIDHKLATQEYRELQRMVRDKDHAKDRFIRSNLRLVVSIAKRYPIPQSMDLLDLIQEGNLGLEHAVDKFDPDMGFKFSTYSTFWIRQAIGRALDQKASIIRLPGDRSASLRAALRLASGDADRLDSENSELFRLTSPVSLNKAVQEDTGTTLGDLMANNDPSPEETVMDRTENEILAKLLDQLDSRARFAVENRFGLVDGERKSFREIGENLGVTAEATRRLISRAVASLREDAEQKLEIYQEIE